MHVKRTNKKLKVIYNKAFKRGRDKFFTFRTDYVTREVMKNVNFRGKRVLEVGCGEGDTAAAIAGAGGRVIAIDYAREAIAAALKKQKGRNNLEFRACEYKNVPGVFDIIVLQEVLEHLDNPLSHLRKLKKKLKPRGKIVITCPSFMNVRGYVWMTLQILFNIPMSLTDINFLCPFDFEEYAKKLNMRLAWHTFNVDLGNNEKMIYDLRDRSRLVNALRDAKMRGNTKALIAWLEKVSQYDHALPTSGAKGIYVLTKK